MIIQALEIKEKLVDPEDTHNWHRLDRMVLLIVSIKVSSRMGSWEK